MPVFTPSEWQGRNVEHPGRIILTPTGQPSEYDQSRSEGTITEAGTPLSAENLNGLEQRVADAFAASVDDNGKALDALKLGGVDAGRYVKDEFTKQTLTLINGWAGGSIDVYRVGQMLIAMVYGGDITNPQGGGGTIVGILPNWAYSKEHWATSPGGLRYRSTDVFGVAPTITNGTFITIVG